MQECAKKGSAEASDQVQAAAVADAKGLAAAGRQKRVRARAAQEVLAAEGDLLHQEGQDCQLQRRRKT